MSCPLANAQYVSELAPVFCELVAKRATPQVAYSSADTEIPFTRKSTRLSSKRKEWPSPNAETQIRFCQLDSERLGLSGFSKLEQLTTLASSNGILRFGMDDMSVLFELGEPMLVNSIRQYCQFQPPLASATISCSLST